MIEVIEEGRVIKFDKEKKIIAFLNVKRLLKQKHGNWATNPCGEIMLPDFHIVDYPDRLEVGCNNSKIKEEILKQRVKEMKEILVAHAGVLFNNA